MDPFTHSPRLRYRFALAGILAGLLWTGAGGLAQEAPVGPVPPQLAYPGLFAAVQHARIFADSKSFADAVAKMPTSEIMRRYVREAPRGRVALRDFVWAHFAVPEQQGEALTAPPGLSLPAHIDALWDLLTRSPQDATVGGSLLPLPRPYVVPGGRFRELYYWDSYFTMLGLAQSGRYERLEDLVADFGALIDSYGHVPNGTRSYYLSRSQPPFFYAMVALLEPKDPAAAWARWLPQLKREHAFWMEGADTLGLAGAHRRVVALPDGSILNRYWDDAELPRDESWSEDVAVAKHAGGSARAMYRELRAAAESGWDFSSRWFEDGRSLASILTTQIVPVDLNSLLYGMEQAIAAGCQRAGDADCAAQFLRRAIARRVAIDRFLWDPARGVYLDYRWTRRTSMEALSAATLYPAFTGAASRDQAARVGEAVGRGLVRDGGLVTSTRRTGQQWDAPNGWAPLQWIAVEGLERNGQMPLAAAIACRWLVNVARVYHDTGKLVEKYDVIDTTRAGGGGEYPLQDGFGWTNGVTRALLARYPAFADLTSVAQCPSLPH